MIHDQGQVDDRKIFCPFAAAVSLWDQIQGIIVSKFEYFHPPLVPLHKEGGHQTGFPGSPPTHQHREATLGTLIKRCAIFSSASIITDGLHTTTCGPSLILNVAVRKFWERHGWATGSRCCRGVSAHRVEGVVGNIIHYRIETNKQLSLIILLTLTSSLNLDEFHSDERRPWFRSDSEASITLLCWKEVHPDVQTTTNRKPIISATHFPYWFGQGWVLLSERCSHQQLVWLENMFFLSFDNGIWQNAMANLFPGLTSEVFLGYDLISKWL